METGDKVAIGILTVVVAASAWAFNYMQPNEGQARFRDDTITVNAAAATEWGADVSRLREWGMPIEFVTGEADVEFSIGETQCQHVEGFGDACVSGEASKTINSRHWVTKCTIVLSSRGAESSREASTVAVHEFGHCLGASHDDTQDSIMGTVMPSENFQPEHWSWTVTDKDRESIPY